MFFFYATVPPNILDEESTQSAVAVRENQNISLVCKADGFPTPKIMWRREDSQPISVDKRKKGMYYFRAVWWRDPCYRLQGTQLRTIFLEIS